MFSSRNRNPRRRSPTPTTGNPSRSPSPNTQSPNGNPLYLCSPFADAALVKGNFKTIVMLPKYVDIMEWVAVNIFDFYTNLNEFYGVIAENCTQHSCPTMSGGPNLNYVWIHSGGRQANLPAPAYIDYVMTSIQNLVADENVFPTKSNHSFHPSFPATVRTIYRQLLRVFAHMYHAHYPQILHLRSEPHFNSLFAHFLAFGKEYKLLDPKDIKGDPNTPVGVGLLWERWKEKGILELLLTAMTATLSLHGRGLKLDTRADIEPYFSGFDPLTLQEIHFGGNTLGVDASLALADFLRKTQVLRIADFADIFTGRLISEIPQALTAICDALKDKPSLVEIDLSDNAFGGRSVDPIVPLLVNNRSFQVLRLNNNGLGPAGGKVIADALLESARRSRADGKKSNLKVVICGRNRLENGSASAWADAFAAHGTLVEVRMIQNGIRMEGIVELARGLAQCPDLEHIELQDNTFIEDGSLLGVRAWTESLGSWSKLHTLNLSDCVLSSDGEVPSLIETLAKGASPKLHTLQLQNNNLEGTTFGVLAGAISQGLSSLMRLELQWNEVEEDDENLENIALALKQRGGKLYVNDDDEEEEEEREREAEKKEEIEEQLKGPKADGKDVADDLANLLGKVAIQ